MDGDPLFAQLHDRFRFDHLRVEQGLSQGSVNDMLQDSRGFLWIATDDGLNRFDGYQFLVFRPDQTNPGSITGNVLSALAEDSEGRLWIGASSAGLQWYDPKSGLFTSAPANVSGGSTLLSSVITALQIDGRDRVWIGTDNAGLLLYDPPTQNLSSVELAGTDKSVKVFDIAMTRSGKLFMACGDAGLIALDPESRATQHIPLPAEIIQAGRTGIVRVAMEGSRYLWVATDDSRVHRYDVRTGVWRVFKLLEATQDGYMVDIRGMSVDAEGNIWIATASDGLFVLQTQSRRITHVREDRVIASSLPSNSIRSLFVDRLGNVWIGMNGSGLALHSPAVKAFNLLVPGLRSGVDLTIHSYRAIFEDGDSVLWLGGYRGFNRLDRKSGTVTVYPRDPSAGQGSGATRGINGGDVFVIHPDPVDSLRSLLLGTEGDGLYRFDKERGLFQRVILEDDHGGFVHTPGTSVYEICRTHDKDLWIGGSSGLWRWRYRQKGSLPVRVAPGYFSVRQGGIYAIHEDRNGFLWIGTARNGLAMLDRLTNDITEFRHLSSDTNSLSSNSVKCIFEDSRGILWIGTSFGLNSMNRRNGTFRVYTSRDGLPNDVIYGILEDASGFLWLSTNSGLARFHPDYGVLSTYDVHDGLQGNEFNTAAFFRSRSGELFFGGVQGLTYFFPDQISRNRAIPPVVVTGVRAGNRAVFLRNGGVGPDTVRLDYRDESITFTFAALSYYRPEKNRYRYRIDGRNDSWIDLGNERYLNFAGLSPGEYILHVQGSNNDGVWNEKGVTITLIIQPPFWASWWFRLLVGLLLSILVYLGFRWRMTVVRAQERRLSVEVEQRTSELQHSNANLLLEIEERKRAEAEAYRANATKSEFLAHISHEIRTPMNAILGFTELLHDRIYDVELRDYLESISVSGKTLLTLINDILDLSKIEAGKLDLVYQPVSIRDITDEIRLLFAYQVSRKQLAFEVSIDESVPPLLYLDETRVRQILLNLVGNAVKFTDKGRISIEVKSSKHVKDTCTLSIHVIDTGVGIAPSQQQRVFEPFRQGGRGRNTDYSGTGLGLAITQRLIQMMGGEISLVSRLGSGSTFRITFSAVSVAAQTMDLDFGDPMQGEEAPAVEAVREEALLQHEEIEAEATAAKEDLRALYDELSGVELLRWERLKRTYLMHEIESFAVDQLHRAARVSYPPLADWSERLVREVRSFDMEHLPITLEEFPCILAVLHEKGKEFPSASEGTDTD